MALSVINRLEVWEGGLGKRLTKIAFLSEGDLLTEGLQESLNGRYPEEVVTAVAGVLSRGLQALDPKSPYFPVKNGPSVFVNRMEGNILAVVWPGLWQDQDRGIIRESK